MATAALADIPPRPPLPAGTKKRRVLTLRQRILLIVIAGIALASTLIGGAAVLTVGNLLENRVDEQLQHLVQRPDRNPGVADPQNQSFLGDPGTGPGALGVLVVDGVAVRSAALSADAVPEPLDDAQNRAILAALGKNEPVTVNIPGLGNYRILARDVQVLVSQTTLRPGVSVVGLPMAATELTLSQLTRAILALAGAVLLLTVGAAYLVIRLALRPLDRVAATAAEVSRLSLGTPMDEDSDGTETSESARRAEQAEDRTEAALRVRVPEKDADERTEVGRVGASLNRMLGHVEESLRVRRAGEVKLRRFVSDASHELRTPLASIRGYSELARRIGGDLPEDIAYSLERIGSESIRMTGIVEDLLLLARLDEGRELTQRPVDLTDIVFHAVNDARAAGPEHPLDFEGPNTPIRVLGDAPRIQQVIVNLLANARVHTPAGTHIGARLAVVDGEAVIEVRDDGPGVSEKVRDHVFERFVRGDESRTRTAGGSGTSGLGLSIVAAVVQAHGGRVALDSEPGNTVFTITLPLLEEDAERPI
ncbi:two-component system OmpR family sensor kinase [Mycetocola sp. BIGb0189]|uniref:sensor histidine kinase n=1 Tax=Mycetocola sp. BIGb0189 TaxID=2940604 RepID=UPI0021699114|nr:HAMP domain-containing sensor histidine kinase [Mycetocola sp. BIGb0189]MCS4277285.1 two-component system OmpR family sensor kinase [Mycetocola sp. BIGb0189]